MYRYVPTNPGKEQTWQKIFAARQELLRHFFCPTNQIVAKFDRHVSHSSENFYETLSEFLNFCILAVSWDIFRQCDLKKKNWWNCMFRKTQKQLKKRLWLHCGILKVLETKGKKWGWHYPSFHSCLFPPNFFHDTAKRRQNWVLYCGLVYKIVLVFTYTLTLLSSPPPCIY